MFCKDIVAAVSGVLIISFVSCSLYGFLVLLSTEVYNGFYCFILVADFRSYEVDAGLALSRTVWANLSLWDAYQGYLLFWVVVERPGMKLVVTNGCT